MCSLCPSSPYSQTLTQSPGNSSPSLLAPTLVRVAVAHAFKHPASPLCSYPLLLTIELHTFKHPPALVSNLSTSCSLLCFTFRHTDSPSPSRPPAHCCALPCGAVRQPISLPLLPFKPSRTPDPPAHRCLRLLKRLLQLSLLCCCGGCCCCCCCCCNLRLVQAEAAFLQQARLLLLVLPQSPLHSLGLLCQSTLTAGCCQALARVQMTTLLTSKHAVEQPSAALPCACVASVSSEA